MRPALHTALLEKTTWHEARQDIARRVVGVQKRNEITMILN
jgi:hypothetical protein